ncbi:MAG TPA: DUF86 domain-containing protein [Candidatus Micrarchaeia archaeon]|nr:DUF86 domain-containing protein [Candidatus Micrarchaeia archaeon]
MVDARRVRRLLQRVSEEIGFRHQRAQLDRAELGADPDRLGAVTYACITAIEGCLDVAQHCCAAEGWGPPASNADAMRLLGRHGVLEPLPAQSLVRAVGFGNVLVHGYVDVDEAIVLR